jgi:AcrR family transcriptional regulator
VPRVEREPEMVAAARAAFAERGFHDTSMDEIAAACGVSKPMLYAYFESKEGLFVACARQAADELLAQVRAAALAEGLPQDERLWRGLIAVFDFVERNREGWAILYPARGAAGGGTIGSGAAEARDAMAALLEELLAENARALGMGEEAVLETRPFAHALTGATMAMAAWWLEHSDEPKELQALRLMNFAWMGFGDILEGRLWLPPE